GVSSEHAAAVGRAFVLAKRLLSAAPAIRTAQSARLGGRTKYQLTLTEGQSIALLEELCLRDKNAPFGVRMTPPSALLRRACCRRAYARGAFLAVGWVDAPERSYQMEFAAPDQLQAGQLIRVLRREGLSLKAVERKGRAVVYLKDGDRLATLLTLMGAPGARLQLEAVRVAKEMRNAVNRQVNCDDVNLTKTVDAAQKQVADIELIRQRRGLTSLPPPLRAVAELRLAHADASLIQLGALLTPPIGKSGVNNRLRRLGALADEIRAKGE
ncbi:MAG: DNA-binding protein WhiA, partial [Clostridiales bacterium]|nr:DNA-binding protein WhiA [Clostridiales bacterium]